jgi:FG-GAP-like repeat/PASTA domain
MSVSGVGPASCFALLAQLCLVVASAASSASGPTFRSKLFFGASMDAGAASVTVGDVNGDGRPDVLAANGYPDDSVTVELNQGHGDFKLRNYSPPSAASSVALAELNGDGKPDLVVATEQDDSGGPYGVSVLLNDSVSVLLNAIGRCGVPILAGQTLRAAKRGLMLAGCRLGKVARAYSTGVPAGRVVSQKPGSGTLRPAGARIDLIVSRAALSFPASGSASTPPSRSARAACRTGPRDSDGRRARPSRTCASGRSCLRDEGPWCSSPSNRHGGGRRCGEPRRTSLPRASP